MNISEFKKLQSNYIKTESIYKRNCKLETEIIEELEDAGVDINDAIIFAVMAVENEQPILDYGNAKKALLNATFNIAEASATLEELNELNYLKNRMRDSIIAEKRVIAFALSMMFVN